MKAASFVPWNEMLRIVNELKRSKSMAKRRMALLIHVGCHIAVRVSDLRMIKWGDVMDGATPRDFFYVKEQKTGKTRRISLNPAIQSHLIEMYIHQSPDAYLFCNRLGEPWSARYINAELGRIKKKYKLKVEVFSTHSLRKTFARRVMQKGGDNPLTFSLIQEILQHSSLGITRKYLGITSEEIESTYLNL